MLWNSPTRDPYPRGFSYIFGGNMNKKRFGVVGVIAAAALAVSALAVPSAFAAKKTIVIWADDTRGPALEKIVKDMEKTVPGYTVSVKSYASYDALNAAWDKATAATGPDIVLRDGGLAISGAKSGRISSLVVPSATRSQFAADAWAGMTVKGRVYGIPTDIDTTAMIYNTAMFPTAPKTIGEIYDYYIKNKATLTNGICSFNGVWGAHPVLTALGGGAWGYKNGQADMSKVVFNSATFKSNAKKYLVGADGKTNGFFSYDGCDTAFKAGKTPVALVGAWNMPGVKATTVKYAWGSLPGLTAGTFGNQWANYAAAYMTSYAATHGVKVGANQLLFKFFASEAGQLALNEAQKEQRPLAHISAAAKTKDDTASGVGAGAKNAIKQLGALDDKTGGSNWYAVGDDALKDIFAGKDIDDTLDKAAAVLAKNFANFAKS
jgi:arabinogalactan oligomer/maltooligosaccharide transport system substrate-binding protein